MSVALERSCMSCIKAKRKCDRLIPQCSRCAQRNVVCRYTNQPVAHTNLSEVSMSVVSGPVAEPRQHRFTEQDLVTIQGRIERMENKLPARRTMAIKTLQEDLDHRRRTWAMLQQYRAMTLLQPGIKSYRMKHSAMTTSYLLDTITYYPTKFTEMGKTPFIHPILSRPRANSPAKHLFDSCIMTVCLDRQTGLQETKRRVGELLASRPMLEGFESMLHSSQALVLAGMLLLFTPNALSKPETGTLLRTLSTWAKMLFDHAPAQLPSSMSHYQAWVLAESVRRTILFSHLLVELFPALTGGEFYHSIFIDALAFDSRPELWDLEQMPDTDSFVLETKLNSYKEFTESYTEGKRELPVCSQAFEVLLAAGCLGIENLRTDYEPINVLRSATSPSWQLREVNTP